MENPRTDAARDHDDTALIDDAAAGVREGGRSGGNLATDVASSSELDGVADPEGHSRVTKQDDIAHDVEQRPDRARGA